MRHARRREALRVALRSRELDALLVTGLLNIRYLTGFTGSHAALLIHADDEPDREDRTVLGTDGRYQSQSAQQVPELRREIRRASALALASGAMEVGIGRLGFESHIVTVDGHAALAEVTGPGTLVALSGAVEALRSVKGTDEVDTIRRACAAADHALARVLADGGLRPGRTEREVARDLEARMMDVGAAGPAFDTIVAAGTNSAVPHHRPTDDELRTGDLVKIDFGALLDGYHSDMTRMVMLGQPTGWQRELYELVADAQAAGRAALCPGVEVGDADAAARQVIVDAGHGDEFLHGLGHGVGLAIHEAPTLSAYGTGTLEAGMAVTVEPGVYLAGRGGVRIEDLLVVTDGEPELLTLTTKDLVVV